MTVTDAVRYVSLPIVVALCACGFGSEVRQQVHQTIPAAAAPAIHLENAAGSVQIDAWSKSVIDLSATKSANTLEALRNVQIDVRTESDGIFITTKYAGASHEGGVSYVLTVPANSSLDVRNGAGSVGITGVRGSVAVTTQAGSITATLGTVAGSRSVVLGATTGSIRLFVGAGSSARVQARSSVGSVSTGFPGVSVTRENVVGATGSGKIGAGSATIRLTTTTGSIALQHAP